MASSPQGLYERNLEGLQYDRIISICPYHCSANTCEKKNWLCNWCCLWIKRQHQNPCHHLHFYTISWIHKLTSHLNLMDGYEIVELEE